MSVRPIIDAGPGLNFMSINKERLLIATLGPLSAPETVQDEVFRKAREDNRFEAAATVWRKLTPRWMQVLSDNATSGLEAVVTRISGLPMDQRRQRSKDLGETMVIAHAVVAAESGQSVIVLMDDGPGARIANSEMHRLRRIGAGGGPVGAISIANTLTVQKRAAGTEHLPDRASMRDTYKRLRCVDDGLLPIEKTDLLAPTTWP